jgi:hypothetical protein
MSSHILVNQLCKACGLVVYGAGKVWKKRLFFNTNSDRAIVGVQITRTFTNYYAAFTRTFSAYHKPFLPLFYVSYPQYAQA